MGLISKISNNGPVYTALLKLAQPADVQPQEQGEAEDPYIYKIPESNLPFLMGKIEKLNKTAAKLNVPPIEVKIVGESFYERKEEGMAAPIQVPLKHVRIEGHAPKLNGWILAARILHTHEGNILKATPDAADLPTDYRNTPPICEYCKTTRDRRDTFLVKNDKTGELKQVGRNCLADFLGHSDPAIFARWAENLADLYAEAGAMEEEAEGDGPSGGRGQRSFTMEQFLLVVQALRRTFGWMSRTVAKQRAESGQKGQSTADMAIGYLSNAAARDEINKDAARLGKPIEIKPEDSELVEKSLDWIRKLKEGQDSNEALSDYLWNLAVASSASTVNDKTAGIVASLLSAYERANSALPANVGSTDGKGYIGEINKSIIVKGKVLGAKPVSSFKGRSILYSVQDEHGNVVKWFDNSDKEAGVKPGDDVMVSGIVKSHKAFNGKPETELQGARFLGQEEYEKLRAEQAVAADAAAKNGPATAPATQYVAGQKIPSIDLTLVDKKYIPGDYGTSTLHTFVDDSGQQFKWFASKGELDIGNKYTCKATVKGEDNFGGKKSINLTRVEVIGVGGQKAVTQKDINAKRKEWDKASKAFEEYQSKIDAVKTQIQQAINPNHANKIDIACPYNASSPNDFDEPVAILQREVEKAKQASATQSAFVPDLEGIDWSLKDKLTTYRRKKTPQEFLQESEPHFNASKTMMDQLRQSGLMPLLKQKQDEYTAMIDSGKSRYSPEASKLNEEISGIQMKIRDIEYKNRESVVQYGDYENKFKNLEDQRAKALQMQQEGGQEFPINPGDWNHNIHEIYHRQTEPNEFIQIAEAVIQKTLVVKQQVMPLMQEIAQLTAGMQPFKAALDKETVELEQLESMKGKAKKAALEDWVLQNCRFARITL